MPISTPSQNDSRAGTFRLFYSRYRKWFKALFYTVAIILLLFVAVWLLMAWYISRHKAELLQTISATANEQLHGNLTIEDMEPALLKGFPNIAIELKGVALSDSMFATHQRNLFVFKSAYLKLNVFSLLSKQPKIVKVTVANGSVHLFKDTAGYTNLYLFKSKKKKKNRSGKAFEIKRFAVEQVMFTFDHFEKEKQLKVFIKSLDGHVSNIGTKVNIVTNLSAHIEQLGFNLERGAFGKNKDVTGKVKLVFDKDAKQLSVPKQQLKIDDYRLNVAMLFDFSQPPGNFQMELDAPAIDYKFGVSCLSEHIATKLKNYNFEKPLAVNVKLQGSLRSPDTPLVNVVWHTSNNILHTSYGNFSQVKMKGRFCNRVDSLLAKNDDNSGIYIKDFSASFGKIPLRSQAIDLYGLRSPMLSVDIKSDFQLAHLNEFVSSTFNLQQGSASVNVRYKGPVLPTDSRPKQMNGALTVKNGAMVYINRGLRFRNCNLNIDFLGEDLHLKKSSIGTRSSTLNIDGFARNFMTAYFSDPSKVIFDWNVQSKQIDLTEFKSLLEPKQKLNLSSKSQNIRVAAVNSRIEQLLDLSSMHLGINVAKVSYGKFSATNIKAMIHLTGDNTIALQNVSVNHAGGLVNANITMYPKANLVPFKMQAQVHNVAIDQLFYAFGNFGQKTLTHENLKGRFSAKLTLDGTLKNNNDIIPSSVNGALSFAFENGSLHNFQPLENIKKYAFKKRNLSHITFNSLKNDLDIKHGMVNVPPMNIESSAILIRLSGVYGIDRGTDLSMSIPLRNPQKDIELIAQGKKPKRDKGIVVHLRALDDGTGKVNIGWDPLKKGLTEEEDFNE